jgi:hypothetical protein
MEAQDPLSREMLLAKIYEAGVALGAIEDTNALLNKVCEISLSMCRCQCVSIFAIEENAIRFKTSLNPGFSDEAVSTHFLSSFLFPLDRSTIAGQCAIDARPIALDANGDDPTGALQRRNYTFQRPGFVFKSALAIPILDAHHQVLGVIELANHVDSYGNIGPFPTQLLQYLHVLATQIATILRSSNQQTILKRSWTETVLRFVKASESRDPETGGHVERMGLYTAMMFEKLGYNTETCEMVRLAAMLHDIGKLAVPDSILKKPGKLTPEERLVMQEHAIAGYNLLANSDSPMLVMGAVIAATHHEKWDGSGYPQGLKGEEIPLIGRVVALADVFDALSSRRCYKEAWPVEKVVETIRGDAGTHFDPSVIELFCNNLATVQQIFHDFSVERFTRVEPAEVDSDDSSDLLKPNLTLPKIA